MKTALITGITGQDGSYLAELLLSRGYEVHGMIRRASTTNTSRIDHISKDLKLHYGDMTDSLGILNLISKVKPQEIYNLAAQSHVAVSFDTPEYTAQSDAIGTLRILESIRILGAQKNIKFYQASTSELFGKVQEIPQKETTPFYPRSPYAAAKLYAYWITVNYRESYDMFACNGILFNHESPRRGENFVTRKITLAAARIFYGLQDIIYLGNLDSKRDWGYAPDYVEAMYRMLQLDTPEDLVISTNTCYTVRDFAQKAFSQIGIELIWSGSGVNEVGIDAKTGKKLVAVHSDFFRPAEVDLLIGDCSKAKKLLNWQPTVTLDKLVEIMMQADLKLINNQEYTNKDKLNFISK